MIKKALFVAILNSLFSLLLVQFAPPLNASESDVVSRFSGDYRCTTENMGDSLKEKMVTSFRFRPDRDDVARR